MSENYSEDGRPTARRRRKRVFAALGAIVAFPVSLYALVEASAIFLTTVYGWGHSADNSAGDSAGWALIILSPVVVPVFLLISAVAAFATYRIIVRRQNPN
jgi:hypothetical protein